MSFHEFPSDVKLCARWKKNISREDLIINDKSPSTVICSRHFLRTDYASDYRIRRLLPGSVPTVFDNSPPDTAPSPKKPRLEPAHRNALLSRKQTKVKEDVEQKQTKVKEEPVELAPEGLIEADRFVERTTSVGTQATNSDTRRASAYLCLIARLRSQVACLRSEIHKLRRQLAEEQEVTVFYRGDKHHATLEKIVADAERGDVKAISLLCQIDRYARRK